MYEYILNKTLLHLSLHDTIHGPFGAFQSRHPGTNCFDVDLLNGFLAPLSA